MKKLVLAFCVLASVLIVPAIHAQTFGSTVCPISAGADQTICAPNCANLTGTYVNTNLPGSGANAYTVASIPYAPDPFNVGTAVALGDDQYSGVIALPFPFCFYGTTYNSCLIGSNGLLQFNVGTPGGYCPWPIPATNAPSNTYGWTNAIMGPWQDLYPPGGGSIRYTTYGTAPCRRFVVSWYQLPMYSCTSTLLTQQITIYETTNVIDNFIQVRLSCGWNSGRAIQGVMNNGGTQAVVVAGRNATNAGWTTNNDGRRYTPNGASNVVVGWYQGAALIQAGATATVCPVANTTYTFQAVYTNCNGTTVMVSDQMVVTASSLAVTAAPVTQTVCNGGTANLTANAAGAVSWQWNIIPGNAFVSNQQNPTVSPTVTTTYVVTATDAAGCQGFDTIQVVVSAMTTQNAGPNDTVCSGGCTMLTASGGVTYQWTANPFLTPPLNTASVNACPTATTIFYVTVTDAAGCTGMDSVTVFVANTVLSVAALGTNVTCFGACDGTGSAAANGGYPPYTYVWSNAMTGANISGLCAGPYTVTVTDAIGCTATASINVTEPTALDVQATNISTANCGQNDGSVTISITGGVPNYIILWSTGGSGLTESNLAPGAVSVTVTDANGCDTTVTFNVPNTPGATVAITSFNNVTCFGACDGDATALGGGGTAPYNYSWSTAPAQLTPTATNLCPGTYTVTMTDANGCSDTAQVNITEPPQLTLVVGTAATICIGQSANLTAQGNGGTPAYNYAWTDGVNNWIVQNPTVSPTVTTTYSCIATDANNCTSAVQTVVITVNPPLSVQAIATQVVCQNTVVNLTANAAGGNGNYTYTWTPGPLIGQNVTVTATQNQTYTVTVTDNCGTPLATDTVSVLINPAPVPTFTTTGAAQGCEPLCVEFVNTTPNTAGLTWVFGNNLGTSQASPFTFCFNTAGSYDVQLTVTDVIGCTGTTTMLNYVTVYPNPIADFTANPNPATELNNIVQYTDLSVGAVSWIWSFGPDDSASLVQNPMYTWDSVGVFMVQLIVENSWGCQDSISLPQEVEEDYALFIPNTFTPNGDGQNDLFFPQGIGIDPANYTMYIFDRWGNLIYQTSVWPGGWDGTVQGKGECQIDTYVYKIATQDGNRAKRVYIGHVNLIR
jgi:gliding motility-associated-like protein